MFSFSSFFNGGLPKFGLSRVSTANAIDIPSVDIHDVETSTDKRDRRLKHLLKLNHANFSILWNRNRYHNHTPHILGSAYLLDASADHLTAIYENAATEGHEGWQDSPGEIALHDYRDFLGKRDYQRAWVDFFEDQLVDHSFDWRQVAARFLFERGSKNSPNPYPMFSCIVGGLGHPLIHLGYAYELASREVGMEALGLVATCYDPKLAALHERAISVSKSNLSYTTTDPFEILDKIRTDTRLDEATNASLDHLLSDPTLSAILLSHTTAWSIHPSPTPSFEASQRLATALLLSTASSQPTNGYGYNFFLLHLLTTSHAIRIIIPFIPAEHHIPLLQEWFLITCALYITQGRPLVSVKPALDYDTNGKTWKDAEKLAIHSEHKFDEHYVKGIRAIKEAAKVWGDNDNFFEKAAVKFAVEFDGWSFSGQDEEETQDHGNERKRRGSDLVTA